jgi:hypothetical protein
LRRLWAAFFTAAGWRSIFQPRLAEHGPDFMLELPRGEVWVEVRGWRDLEKLHGYTPRLNTLEAWLAPREVLLLGSGPLSLGDTAILGLLRHGECLWQPAVLIRCPACEEVSFCGERSVPQEVCRVNGCRITGWADQSRREELLAMAEVSGRFIAAHRVTSSQGVRLDVPFEEKDQAKALGARWDRDRRCWCIPEGADPTSFRRWLPRRADA